MCSPTAFMVISTIAAMAQSYMATKAQNKQAEAQAEAANKAASYDYQTLAEQRGEVDEQAAADKLQRQLQTRREHGRITVAMGEAGVGGNSAMRVMNNAIIQGSYDTSIIEANRAAKARQINREMGSVHARAEGRVNIAKSQTISPGMGALRLGFAGISGGASGYTMGKSMFGGNTMDVKGLDDSAKLGRDWRQTNW